MKKALQFALIKTIPILLGYLFLGIAYGLLLQKSGWGIFWAFLTSFLIYAGSMQFSLVGILTGGLSYDPVYQQPPCLLRPFFYRKVPQNEGLLSLYGMLPDR